MKILKLIILYWVLDVANLPLNQCQAFLEGKAHHFIEIDPTGEIKKIY